MSGNAQGKRVLPIEALPGNRPRTFRWYKRVHTISGQFVVPCTGTLPPGVEDAVMDLIDIVHQQDAQIAELKSRVAERADGKAESKNRGKGKS